MSALAHPAMTQLIGRVHAAFADESPLCIRGGGSKDFYGGPRSGDILDIAPLSGISSYEPSELVITVLAGTTLAELEATLAERHQHLPFEPPRFGNTGTVGGMIAAGLSGPARASAGSVRDYVLGATLLNGRAQLLTFGGQVMKNVAGYDVSRVLAGSLGALGVITEVSLKLMPVPPADATLQFELNEADALRQLNIWAGQPLPLNASCWSEAQGVGRLHVRLRGAKAAIEATCLRLGGRRIDDIDAAMFWNGCRDHSAHWFAELDNEYDLWRLSVPQTTPALPLPGSHLVEWHGGLRWYSLPPGQASNVREITRAVGGHATLFKPAIASEKSVAPFDALSEPLQRIHRRLKQEFDPHGIFNRGRLYGDM